MKALISAIRIRTLFYKAFPTWLIIAFQSELHPTDMVAISNRRLDFCFEVGFLVVHNIFLLYCIIYAQIMLVLKYSGVGWIKSTPLVRSYPKKQLVWWSSQCASLEVEQRSNILSSEEHTKVINWKMLGLYFEVKFLLQLCFVFTFCINYMKNREYNDIHYPWQRGLRY